MGRHALTYPWVPRPRRWRDAWRRYQVTEEAFETLVHMQRGRCGICRERLESPPHIDHNHETGQVRGLLCGNCNRGLGRFRDDHRLLMQAAAYVATKREAP